MRGVPVHRGDVRDYVQRYTTLHGRTPTIPEVADGLQVAEVTAAKLLKQLRLAGELEPHSRTGQRAGRDDDRRALLTFIRSYTLQHGWPPTQRESADALVWPLSKTNAILGELEAQGLIEVGPSARAVRIVGTVMTIPEVAL
jgi:SOS-response transcriptional repressor LexA